MLKSYIKGEWTAGHGDGQPLVNPTTEGELARSSTAGLDLAGGLAYARQYGNSALRELTFAERARLIKAMSRVVHEHRDELIEVAIENGGNTRSDAKFDIDGASFTLAHYAEVGAALGDARFLTDGDAEQLGRSPRFVGRHIAVPLTGVAVHINAFNFPAWGWAEKAAVALLAGMPVLTKPATSTALLTVRLVERIVASGLLPDGALSLVAGAPRDLLDHLGPQDVVAFTGSGVTGARIRAHEAIRRHSVRVNVEADSLNAAVLGPDVELGSETYDLFVREVVREVTQKAGQKCTATRRIFVPAEQLPEVRDDLVESLDRVRVGDPSLREVQMGPVTTRRQLEDVRAGIAKLAERARFARGSGGRGELVGLDDERGYFVEPTLLTADAADAGAVHDLEVFGPVATLMAYSGRARDAVQLLAKGGGGLVASVYTDELTFARQVITESAPHHGRIALGSAKVARHSPGPGTVLPQLVHGGPGRAGGGEELGGVRGLDFYLQRTALQGDRPLLDRILGAG